MPIGDWLAAQKNSLPRKAAPPTDEHMIVYVQCMEMRSGVDTANLDERTCNRVQKWQGMEIANRETLRGRHLAR